MLPAGHPASYVARIPNLRLAMPNLVEAEYLVCVARMLGIEDPNGNAMMINAMQVGLICGAVHVVVHVAVHVVVHVVVHIAVHG